MSDTDADASAGTSDDAAAVETGATDDTLDRNEVVLITGTSSGIGRATALEFLEAGWTVYATARDTDDIADLAEAGCETAELDVTDGDRVEAVVEEILDAEGRIDCLVNNAGYGQFGPVEDVPTETVHEQFDVNLYGPHRLIRAVLPGMRERGDGTIVNVSSTAGRLAYPMGGTYSASKFALEAMSDALRAEVDDYGIDVVLVQPGAVQTEFTDRAEREVDGLERSGAYQTLYSTFEDARIIAGSSPAAIPPERVAEVIVESASMPDPEPRRPVGRGARAMTFGRFVPDRWRDQLYAVVQKFV